MRQITVTIVTINAVIRLNSTVTNQKLDRSVITNAKSFWRKDDIMTTISHVFLVKQRIIS